MSTIIKLKLATAIIDATLRASRLGEREVVPEHDALVLQWLREQPGLPGAELAWRCGRGRGNTHRTLKRLQARGIVEPLPSVVSGKTCGWALTDHGEQVCERMSATLREYERQLAQAEPDLGRIADRLLAAMKKLLRPYDHEDGRQRLVRPERRDRLQEWDW